MLKLGIAPIPQAHETTALPPIITPPVTLSSNWPAWDGSNDGAVTNIATAGGTGGQDIAAASDSEAVIAYRDSNNNLVVEVLDINNKVMSDIGTNTPLILSVGITPITIYCERITPHKFLVVCLVSSDQLKISLITKTGKTLVETDTLTNTDISYQFYLGLTLLSDTKAAFYVRDGGTAQYGVTRIIDFTGDSLSLGAALSTGIGTKDKIAAYPSVVKASANSFWLSNRATIYYCSYDSLNNITIEDSTGIIPALTNYNDTMGQYLEEDAMLLAYERHATNLVNCNVFRWNGSTITRGTESDDIFGGSSIFTGSGTSCLVADKQIIFSGKTDDVSPAVAKARVVSVDESDNITLGPLTQTSANVIADHTVVDVTPSGNYIFCAYQDETSIPLQQIGTRVLQGF